MGDSAIHLRKTRAGREFGISIDVARLEMPVDIAQLVNHAFDIADARASNRSEDLVEDDLTTHGTEGERGALGDSPQGLRAAASEQLEHLGRVESSRHETSAGQGCIDPPDIQALRSCVSEVTSTTADATLEDLRALFDPEAVPLKQVVIAFAPAPPQGQAQPAYHPITAKHSRSKASDTARENKRAYERKKKANRVEKRKESMTVPNVSVDSKLAKIWNNCKVLTIAWFDFAETDTVSTMYAGPKGRRLKEIPAFHLPLIADLVAAGFTLVRWLAGASVAATDCQGRIVLVLAGMPRDRERWQQVVREARIAMDSVKETLRWTKARALPDNSHGAETNRRGPGYTAAIGLSHGGGQSAPALLSHKYGNGEKLLALRNTECVTQIRLNADTILKYWQPKIYEFYTDLNIDLKDHDASLESVDMDTAFAAMSFNFSPNAMTYEHMDHQNYAGGFCVVTSLGDYDATRGGHLFLRELGLVVEFPVGASVLLPSAVIAHGNTSVSKTEHRASITMYTAAGNVRWRDQKYKTQDSMTDVEKKDFLARLTPRRAEAIDRLSKIGELGEDQKMVALRRRR